MDTPPPGEAPSTLDATRSYAKLPMRFEQNAGQFDAAAKFVARSSGATLFLTDDSATIRVPSTTLVMRVAGARKVTPRGEGELITKSSYFIGNDPARWRTDVPNFGRVTYPGVLAGVDLVYHGEDGQLEYDFVVAPGADTAQIAVEIEGAEGISLSSTGDLAVHTERGDLVQRRPRVFQRDDRGIEHDVVAEYRLVGPRKVGFEVAAYDRTRELVIDPVLMYATYLGGGMNDAVNGETKIAVDGSGNAYVAGRTFSTDFPTMGPFQMTASAIGDVFVSKLNATGNALVYSTYLGGDSVDVIGGIAVDGTGSAYLTGYTVSSNFPSLGPIQQNNGGGRDAFVTKLNAAGNALVYSTYLGGSGTDEARSIAVGAGGDAYVAGYTESGTFPIANALQEGIGSVPDCFVARLNAAGSALVYSTFLGGSGFEDANGIAVDAAGNAYVAGGTTSLNFPTTPGAAQTAYAGGMQTDGFIVKLNPTGSALLYGTYLGGTSGDYFHSIAVDAAGAAYVTGFTVSANFPTVNPLQAAGAGSTDALVAKLNPAGSAFVYATYLGGQGEDSAYAIAVDGAGNAYVTGYASMDFPTTVDAAQAASGGGRDAFIVELNAAGSALVYGTYFGGSADEWSTGIAIGPNASIFVTGQTDSTNLPTLSARQAVSGGMTDVFVTRIGTPPVVPPALSLSPSSASVAPKGSTKFTAQNAVVGGFIGVTFAVEKNASGGSIDGTGAYTAGTTGGVVDVVRVTDSTGASARANVTVTASLSIMPKTSNVAAGAAIAFAGAGGSGQGFTYSLPQNPSGGSIDAASGAYVAGMFSGDDVVRVTDSLGNTASALVTVAGTAPGPGTSSGGGTSGGVTSDGGTSAGGSANDGGRSTAIDGKGNEDNSAAPTEEPKSCSMSRPSHAPSRDLGMVFLILGLALSLRRRSSASKG